MRRMMLAAVGTVLLIMAGAPGSGQTVFTDEWKDGDYRGPVKKIAVFWILQVSQNRLIAENEFVRQLKERGITAMPLYVVIPPGKFVEREEALAKIRDLGVNAVLTVRPTDRVTAQSQIPQTGAAGSSLSGYYQYVYQAPTISASEPAYMEMNLFDVKSGKRIWSARTVSKIDEVNQAAVSGFIKIAIGRLASAGLIP